MATQNMQVVIADDDQQTAEVVGDMVAMAGFEPVLANSAYEALGHVVDKKPAVVISDVRMHGIDGVEFLRKTMAMRDPDLAVILMSGWAMMSEEEAMDLGSFGLLDKPFHADKLIAMVTAAARRLEDRWHADGSLPETHMRIDDRVVSLDHQHLVAYGRSGMFIPILDGDLPNPEQHIELALTGTSVVPTNGIGLVRWVRPQTQGLLPRGIGVEYVRLSDVTRQALVRTLREERIVTCIPARPGK